MTWEEGSSFDKIRGSGHSGTGPGVCTSLPLAGLPVPHLHMYIVGLVKSKALSTRLVCDGATEKAIVTEEETEKDSEMQTQTHVDRDRDPERPGKA